MAIRITTDTMKKPLLFLALFLILNSCMDNEMLSLETGEFPLGSWTVSEWQQNGFTLERNEPLPENTLGYSFNKNGKSLVQTYRASP